MKWLICCVIFVINIRANGKASIDTLMPTFSSGYLEDITRNSENLSCYRPCKIHVKPKRCHFIFKVAPSIQDDGKANIAINDTVPGPSINVCQNDIVIVEVQNKIPDQDLAIHWHGLEQTGTPYMDGVPMITQCPIFYGQTYKYTFRASKPGTYFYHAHSVSHQSDGVFGALVVSQPSPLEPLHTHYDYDRSIENTLLISASFPKLLTASLEDLIDIKPRKLEVNGDENYKIFMIEGYSYRLRLINAIAIDCPLAFSIDDDAITIISTDNSPAKPLNARSVLLYPGERMDVVVKANQTPAGHWLRVLGREKCEGLEVRVAAIYSGVNYTATVPLAQKLSAEMNPHDGSFGQMFHSVNKDDIESDVLVKSYYLGIDKNNVNFKETDNDFSYISDAIPKKPFYPASLSLRNDGVIQINGKSFLYPDAPFLTQQEDVNQEAICNVGKEELHKETQCIQTLQASKDETVELILVNEGFRNNDTYTFHMHGYDMQVLATGQTTDNKPISKNDFYKLQQAGKVNRNNINPIEKDTIIVPNKGYVIVRLKLVIPGSWLLECRSCSISSLPTAILINVPQTFPKSVTDSLPKCGNYRPPDVLLN